jgi:RNA polymerase sigma-70 factor (sigma-E family)
MSRPDDASFEEFVHASWPSLRQGAYALTGSVPDAEDLVQTVLVRAYARWSRVGRDNPVAYVRRSLVNAYVDTWRRRQRFREHPVDEVPEMAGPTSYDVVAIDDRLDLAGRLAQLSPRERTMLVMRHYFDLPEREVAELMGCSVGTVKSTCSRALARLRIPVSTPTGEQR